MLKVDDVLEILSIPLLGIVPRARKSCAPRTSAPRHAVGCGERPARAYMDAAKRLMGQTIPMNVPSDKKGLFGKFFNRRAA